MPLSDRIRKRLAEVGEQARSSERQAKADADVRDAVVVRAHEQGGSLREIADAVGLSHVGIQKIINRRRRPPVS